MTYEKLAETLFNGKYGQYTIRSTLRRFGYARYVAYAKPPISEKNRELRLEFALEHRNWTQEQWAQVLWTDETWIRYGRHHKSYVTQRKGEELDPTCIVEKEQRKRG